MCNVVTHSSKKATNLFSQKCSEIDMLKDKFDMRGVLVKLRSLAREETHTTSHFRLREYEEPDKEHNRNEQEDKIGHGN